MIETTELFQDAAESFGRNMTQDEQKAYEQLGEPITEELAAEIAAKTT